MEANGQQSGKLFPTSPSFQPKLVGSGSDSIEFVYESEKTDVIYAYSYH